MEGRGYALAYMCEFDGAVCALKDLADFSMLERSFPNAIFVLNTRAIGKWGQSIHQHIACRRKMANCIGEVGGPDSCPPSGPQDNFLVLLSTLCMYTY